MQNTLKKSIFLSVLTSSTLIGADVPSIGDIEKQIQEPNIQKMKSPIPIIKTQKYKKVMKDTGKTIFIKNFTFSKNKHISSDILHTLTKEYRNKYLTFSQISELTSSISELYKEKKFFLARAYIPQQNIQNNSLEIAIVEGYYGNFIVENTSLVENSSIQDVLDDVKETKIISSDLLEKAMLLINDKSGIQISKIDVKAGSEVGTSDFSITTQATAKYGGYILLDNYGSIYTDKNRLMIGSHINSPFKIGDKLSLSGLISDKTNLKNGKLSYLLPLMSNGLTTQLSYSQTNYSLVDEYENLDAIGASKTLELKLKYPLLRTKVQNIYSTIHILNKNLKDEVGSTNDITKKNTQSVIFGIDYDKSYILSGVNTRSNVKVNLTYGKLDFDDNAKKIEDEAGANTNGKYSKINLDLFQNIVFSKQITIETSLKMQYALGNKNLDGSEDFSIGGSSGVKVYPSGELSAENGYVFSIESKYHLPPYNSIQSSMGFFYDRGKAFMADNNVNFNSRTLQDIGIGFYPRYKDFFGKLQVAWTVDNKEVTSEPNRESKVLIQAGWVF